MARSRGAIVPTKGARGVIALADIVWGALALGEIPRGTLKYRHCTHRYEAAVLSRGPSCNCCSYCITPSTIPVPRSPVVVHSQCFQTGNLESIPTSARTKIMHVDAAPKSGVELQRLKNKRSCSPPWCHVGPAGNQSVRGECRGAGNLRNAWLLPSRRSNPCARLPGPTGLPIRAWQQPSRNGTRIRRSTSSRGRPSLSNSMLC